MYCQGLQDCQALTAVIVCMHVYDQCEQLLVTLQSLADLPTNASSCMSCSLVDVTDLTPEPVPKVEES